MDAMDASTVYRYPRYYAIGYQWNTKVECDFLDACLAGFYLRPEHVEGSVPKDRHALLLDVREPHEYEIVHIEGAKLIPLSELHLRTNELDTANTVVVHCHHGPRSQQALEVLEHFGFRKLKHMHGGIDAWAEEVDTSR